ncbi:3249_t:CDS:2, partial [Acaulospora morrowiae]
FCWKSQTSTANWVAHGTFGGSELRLPPPIGSVHDKLAFSSGNQKKSLDDKSPIGSIHERFEQSSRSQFATANWDIFVKNAFTEEEMHEIVEKKSRQDPLEIDDEILEYINTFSKNSTIEIRKALNTIHPRLGDNFNLQKDFTYDHIRTTVADWLRLLEMQPNSLTLDMPEAWYRINVWRMVDIAFSDIPYTYVIGGEKVELISSERKNRYRTLSNIGLIQRKAIAKKEDAYIRTIGSISTDWAASEADPKWQGMHDTKLMKESGLSLPRTLKDIFIHLADKIKFAEEKLRKLNVIGFVHTTQLDTSADTREEIYLGSTQT